LYILKKNIIYLICIALFLIPTSAEATGMKGKEVLGIRLGGVATSGELKRVFGSGSELEIYFIEGVTPWLGINISFSSHNLGYSNDMMKNIEFLGTKMDVKLNIYSATLGITLFTSSWRRFSQSFEAGGGLYAIVAIMPIGFYEGRITDNQAGLYCGTTTYYKIGKKIMLDACFKYHHVFSGADLSHTIYFYTGSETTSIYQFTFGVTFFTD